jgi:uncharacterized protein YecT (DUF1311 family)
VEPYALGRCKRLKGGKILSYTDLVMFAIQAAIRLGHKSQTIFEDETRGDGVEVRLMKMFVFAFWLVAVSAGLQSGGEIEARHMFRQGEGIDTGEPTLQAQAIQSTKPRVPTAKDLEECRAVLDKEGHGPDPGSSEWWAACERLRARRGAPSFDCSKASGRVEKLICSDPELASLDVELAHLYKALSSQATGQKLKAFRTYQRGWIKGRNDCWKAVAVGVLTCVEASYRTRIRELRSQP